MKVDFKKATKFFGRVMKRMDLAAGEFVDAVTVHPVQQESTSGTALETALVRELNAVLPLSRRLGFRRLGRHPR